MQTPVSQRGRSREPRESYDDEDENSFESYDSYASASDDDSYEPASERKLDIQESTEYESSYSSASDDVEPPTPSVTEYESDTSGGGGPHIVTRKNSPDSISSTSHEEFEDETEFEEDSDGEFGEDKGFDFTNSTSEDAGNDDDSDEGEDDESESENEEDDEFDEEAIPLGGGEEIVKMGEQDDDLFWKRYGYSQQVGTFGDESGGSNHPFGEDDSSQNSSDAESENDSDFDDGDTFKNELYTQAFPSVAGESDGSESKTSTKEKVDFGERIKGWFRCFQCPSFCDFSGEIFQGNFKWYILGAIILISVGAALAVVLPKDDKDNTEKNPLANSYPTVTPTSSLPTLPPGQVMESITFFALIPGGKDESITEEELEMEFSAVLNILAPQVLLDNSELIDENDANSESSIENRTLFTSEDKLNDSIRLRGRRLKKRRKLEASSVKFPVVVDIIEIACADTVPDPSSDLCVKAKADIILITDDGTISFDYYNAVEDAIEDGQLQIASEETGSNLTFVILDEEDLVITPSPTTTVSPTITPRPSASPAPTTSCYDKESSCEQWANQDPSECDVNPDYMGVYCVKSCGLCVTNSPTTASPTNLPVAAPIDLPTISATMLPSVPSVELVSVSPTSIIPSISPAPTIESNSASPVSPFDASESPSLSWGPTLNDLITSENVTSQPTSSPCVDQNEGCAEFFDDGKCLLSKCVLWASEGECDVNPTYMATNCAKSCNKCIEDQMTESPTPFEDSESDSNPVAPTMVPTNNDVICVDEKAECVGLAADEQCTSNPDWMLQNCKLSCNVCSNNDNDQGDDLGNDEDEGQGNDPDSDQPSLTLSPCADNNDNCGVYAADNQCSINPSWMLVNCRLSCNVCESENDDEASPSPSSCSDNNDKCGEWAADNQCSENPSYMLQNCKLSCNVCESEGDEQMTSTPSLCSDSNDKCAGYAADDQCSSNPSWMLQNCKLSCNACDTTGDEQTPSTPSSCSDNNDKCTEWAADNQCTSNPTWMLENCKASCGVCVGSDISGLAAESTSVEFSSDKMCKDAKEDCHESSESGECLLSTCAWWASEGECEAAPTYMLDNCAKSCGKCQSDGI